jgi:uncharacterized protein (DUF1778 family)
VYQAKDDCAVPVPVGCPIDRAETLHAAEDASIKPPAFPPYAGLSGYRQDVIMKSRFSTTGIAMNTLNISKTERIDVRANPSVKLLLQEAARACHKNVSEFLLDAGVTAANQALAERRHFVLNDDRWQAFQQALDRPVQAKPRLKKLLSEPGVLD